jgi:hypothetical protein
MNTAMVVEVLRGADVLSSRDKDRVMSKGCDFDRARELLTVLERKGESAGIAFVLVLAAKQPALYSIILSGVMDSHNTASEGLNFVF